MVIGVVDRSGGIINHEPALASARAKSWNVIRFVSRSTLWKDSARDFVRKIRVGMLLKPADVSNDYAIQCIRYILLLVW